MNTEGSRLQSPEFAANIWTRLRDDDRDASKKRAQVDEMVNGEEPFIQSELDDAGQGDSYNFNDREAAGIIANECAAYADLIAPKNLIQLKVGYGDVNQQRLFTQTIKAEFSDLVRASNTFDFYYSLLVRQRNTHGFGVMFWPDEIDFRPKACGWSDFKLPKNTPAMESAISIAAALYPMEIAELFSIHQSCQDVESTLWNHNLLKTLVKSEAKRVLGDNNTSKFENWEYLEQQLKENGAYFGDAMACKVWVVHFWITEEDGTITHAIMLDPQASNDYDISENKNKEWLYFNKSRYTNINEVLVTFTYEDTISGTYHAARGRGWMIAPQATTNNTLACALADQALESTKSLFQIENPSQTDMDRMAFAHVGHNTIMPAGVKYVQRQSVDSTRTVLPIMDYLQGSLRRNNTGARPQMEPGDHRQPAAAHRLAAEDNAALSAVALGRFYKGLDKVYAQMFARAIAADYQKDDPGGKLVHEFREKLKKQGITQEVLDSCYCVKAQRTIGAGSAANRLHTYERLEGRKGSFDPEGRRNFDFDILSEELGDDDLATRYMEPTLQEFQRQPLDVSIADFENFKMKYLEPTAVLPNQDHFTHAATHLPPLMTLMDELDQRGENVDLPYLTNLYQHLMTAIPHIAQHTQFMSQDRSRIDEVKGLIQLTQQLSAASDRLRNQIMRLQKAEEEAQMAEMQRQQAQHAAYVAQLEQQVQQGGQEGNKAQAMIIEAQVKAKISEAEHAQKLAHREQMFNLEKAIRDANAAADLLRNADRQATETAKQPEP